LFAFKHEKIYAYIFFPFAIALFISTLYLRYHYFIDMIAGFLLAIIIFFIGPAINNYWEKKSFEYKLV